MLTIILVIVGFVFIVYGFIKMSNNDDKRLAYASFILTAVSFMLAVVTYFGGKTDDEGKNSSTTIAKSSYEAETTYGKESESTERQSDFSGNEISGTLAKEQSDKFTYVAAQTGKYRFDFEINNVNNSYFFYIYDEQQNEIVSSYSSSEGVNVELEKGRSYTICMEWGEGDVEYKITIGVPNPQKDVIGNVISDELTYKEQENYYTYKAQITGIYRFDFDIDDINSNYELYIYNSKSEELSHGYYTSDGRTIELEKGQVYMLKVVQYEGLAKYKISIGVPNEATIITDNNIKGQLIYTDQRDVYYYKAPRTGNYRFDFDINDVSMNYEYVIYDEKNEELKSSYCSSEGVTVELEKNKTYKIYVEQTKGNVEYNITINVPKSIVTTSDSVLKGSISYIDQQNTYMYSVNKTKEYSIELDINNVKNSYRVTIYDEKNEELYSSYSSSDSGTVKLKKGGKYKIYVSQVTGFAKYTIRIK